MKLYMVGTLLAFIAIVSLVVALVSRLKISPGLRKRGIEPERWRQRVEIAGALTSALALILSIFMLVPPGVRRGRLAWDPVMEMNPVVGIQQTRVHTTLSTGAVIRETTIGVSDEEQQAELGPVTVIIPPGTLEKTEAVQARQAPEEIMPPVEAATLAFVDIRIGEMTRFENPLTLKFPVKDLAIDPDLPPGQQFFAAYFDAGDRSWKQVPFSVNPADKTISIRTDHLTVYWIGNLFSLDGKYCTVYFLPSETRSVNSGYESALGITTTDRLPLSIIRDIAFFVDTAHESYSLPGTDLPLPGFKSWRLTQAIWGGKISVLAFSGSNASWFEKQTGKSETFTGTWAGDININLDAVRNSKDKLEELRNDCAHELFHLIQREEYGIPVMYLYNFRAAFFWFDAAAECAASTLAWRTGATRHGRELGPTRANLADIGFLKETLVSNGDPHRYQAARFIEYLLARCRLTARALLDIPQLDSVFSVSFDKFMAANGSDLTLARAYDDFAAFFVFDPASPRAMGSGGIFLEVKKYFSGTLLRFKEMIGNVPRPVPEMDWDLAVNDRCTSDMTCFRPDLPCTITLSIEQEDRYVSAGVFPDRSEKAKKVVSVFRDNPASFKVAAQETLVLLFTPLSAPAAVRVHVKPQRQAANPLDKVIDKQKGEPGGSVRETAPPPPVETTPDAGAFNDMLQRRYNELRQLSEEVGQLWNKLQDCCSDQAHFGTPPDGMAAIMSVEKFGQCRLGCRNCGMKFSTRESKRSNGRTYYEHYRERVEYYDKLLQQAPPGFWDTHQYEEYGGLNIIEKK